MTEWYYVDLRHERQGPVAQDALVSLFRTGALNTSTLAWRDGMSQWTPLGDLAEGLGIAATPVAAPPAAAQEAAIEPPVERPLTGRAVFTASEPSYATPPPVMRAETGASAADSPYAAPRADIGVRPYAAVVSAGHVVHAGFWKRTAAYLIDYLITSVIGGFVGMIIGAVMGGMMGFADDSGMVLLQLVSGLVGFAISVVYFSWFQSSSLQATPGKLAIGIKVTRSDGEPISFLRAVGRCFAMILSGLILFIGYVMAGFTERKQALHDMMCDTLVVDKWAFTAYPDRQREELGTVTLVVLIIGGLLFVGAILLVIAAIGAAAALGR
ncbi:hypothetical protein ASD77_04025 [Pseudoxanthomonas sp. Root65]|uniref:RDD family protein n=1 Tax=Pseudoxanthomonas sp. Root65 TaxID=1736576 RepID=UPI0006F605A3|nr:RDD family protein [Pseudoxanthomonas sp. Root65]KRA53821.1 hypothetical protein ASD77_04025 [Pseudoxanthomonas sp. Root65]